MRGPAGLEAAALIDRDVDDDRAGSHVETMSSVTRCGALAPGTSTAPITRSACSRAARSRGGPTSRSGSARARSGRRTATARRSCRRWRPLPPSPQRSMRRSSRPCPPQDHDASGRDAGGAAHEHAAAAWVARGWPRRMRSHPSGVSDIGARSGSRPSASCTVSYATAATPRSARNRVSPSSAARWRYVNTICPSPEPLVLLRLRLLHLEDHVGGGEDGIGIREDLGTRRCEVGVRERRAVTRPGLDDDAVARVHELADPFRRCRDPELVVLDLLRDPDDHRVSLLPAKRSRHRNGHGSDGRPSAMSRASAVFASRTFPARAAATITSNGCVCSSMPSSGSPSGSAFVRAQNR